jgi:hypothetical protein
MFDRTDAIARRSFSLLQNRLAEGGTLLPQRYKRLVNRAQSSMLTCLTTLMLSRVLFFRLQNRPAEGGTLLP